MNKLEFNQKKVKDLIGIFLCLFSLPNAFETSIRDLNFCLGRSFITATMI